MELYYDQILCPVSSDITTDKYWINTIDDHTTEEKESIAIATEESIFTTTRIEWYYDQQILD